MVASNTYFAIQQCQKQAIFARNCSSVVSKFCKHFLNGELCCYTCKPCFSPFLRNYTSLFYNPAFDDIVLCTTFDDIVCTAFDEIVYTAFDDIVCTAFDDIVCTVQYRFMHVVDLLFDKTNDASTATYFPTAVEKYWYCSGSTGLILSKHLRVDHR